MKLIDKDAVLAEIEKRIRACGNCYILDELTSLHHTFNSLEVKEIDLNALGILANHLIACDAHLVTPKYTDKEWNILEEWAKNNKAQKGE